MFRKIAALLVAGLIGVGVAHAAEEGGLEPANIRLDDVASMQRGARLFFNYCSGCHSLRFLRYSRIAEDLKLDPKDVEQNFMFAGGKIGDPVISHMPPEDGAKWFGKAPPDLSLEARSKPEGWIYNYLKSFYVDPSRPLGWNNTLFPNVSMPNALWELQGIQTAVTKPAAEGRDASIEKLELHTPGRQNAEEFDRTARDIATFLQYVGEPAALQRESMGVWVLLYLALFTLLAYLLKHEFWKDVH
jgi:ubiquinol-cytochrome c reductase cytochrome c1 subunit